MTPALGVIVALPVESRTLTDSAIGFGEIQHGPWGRLIVSGMGAEHAAAAAVRLLESGARGLIGWGCAGGLAPTVRPGQLVLPKRIQDRQNPSHRDFGVDPEWHERLSHALAGLQPTALDLVSTPAMLTDAPSKARVYADSGASGVDLESAAIGRVAERFNVPFAVIRVIADSAHTALPPIVLSATDHRGHTSLPKLLAGLARQPSQLPGLVRLGVEFQAAQKTLSRARAHLISQWPMLATH